MSGRDTRARCAVAWACSLIAALGGCDGLGRALVDERVPVQLNPERCERLPDCSNDPLPEPPQNVPVAPAPLLLSGCGGRPAQIGRTSGAAPGQIAGAGANSCEMAEPIDEDGRGEDALAEVDCDSVRIRVQRSGPTPRVLRVIGARLSAANVTLESEAPLRVELIGASLEGVWFELVGPVTLHIEDSEKFDDVRVASAGLGPAAVELESVTGGPFVVGADAVPDAEAAGTDEAGSTAPFAGDVAIWRSRLRRVRAALDTLMLESSSLADVALSANTFQAADATLNRVMIDARHIQLSVSTVESGDFSECETFSILSGSLNYSRIEPCDDALRLYGGEFLSGSIEGKVVLDRAQVKETRFGLHEPTEIVAWDTGLERVRFCQNAPAISFGGNSAVSCTNCDTDAGECSLGVCVFTTGLLDVTGLSDCSADFVTAAALPPGTSPACVQPEPLRMRPPLY